MSRRGFDVTDDKLDAPDGALIYISLAGGWFERHGSRWEPTTVQCAKTLERRGEGKRYVYARWRCRKHTNHPSGYCDIHRMYASRERS